uniref:Endonuclease/exonuclease/phosphatase domain-containing protein n=1 Tax=Octopus bimaculoides TaxID=37653 RepID=A0A0L8IFM1_OCTBM
MGDFNGHVGKWNQGSEGVHGRNGIGERNLEGRMLLEFCDEKEFVCGEYVVLENREKEGDFQCRSNETEIDFMLVGRKNRKYLRDVNTRGVAVKVGGC